MIAAADALARQDDGLPPRPGDAARIAAYEADCQRDQARFELALAARQQAELLAASCPGCVEGGTGVVCDDCWAAGFGLPAGEIRPAPVWLGAAA